jgi:hypothetical protein
MARSRVYRTAPSSIASIYLQDNSASIIGDERHFVICDDRGTTIKGPISIIADATGRRVGGLFTGMNDFAAMIPSTIVTPMPQNIPFPPTGGIVNLTTDVAFFMALLV